MAFCDALRLLGFGPCETKVNNIIHLYIKIIHYFFQKVHIFMKKVEKFFVHPNRNISKISPFY